MREHKLHHNEHNFQRGSVEDDWEFDDLGEIENPMQQDDFDELHEQMGANKSQVRKRIDEYLEKRRMKVEDADPFDEDYY